MQTISAKILDATHLELSQPLDGAPGQVIEIYLLSEVPIGNDDETSLWREAGKQHLLDVYTDADAVYDRL
jgi:hypothetical protein